MTENVEEEGKWSWRQPPSRLYELTPDEVASMKRTRDRIYNMEPGDPFDDDFPDHDGAEMCRYVNAEGGLDPDDDPAISAELLGSQTLFGMEHAYWLVRTRTGRAFWVIENPATACYDADTFDHITVAMYQHIGSTVTQAAMMSDECPYH
jgi:hypothetical protein